MNKRRFIQALVVVLILTSIPLISSAAASKKKIDVIYQGIKLIVDNVEKKTSPEPFIYNGTIYVPAKSIAESIGKKYTYKNNKVYISDTGTTVKEYREVYLAKRPYISADAGDLLKIETTNDKVPSVDLFYDPINQDGSYSLVYALNGQAKTLSCSIGVYDSGSDSPEVQFSFYDENDKLLYSSGFMKKGMDLLPVDVNVSGTLQIKIKTTVKNTQSYKAAYPYLKDLKVLTTDY